jgi:hypothetical protein
MAFASTTTKAQKSNAKEEKTDGRGRIIDALPERKEKGKR